MPLARCRWRGAVGAVPLTRCRWCDAVGAVRGGAGSGALPAQSIIPYLVGVAWFTLAFAQLAPTLRSTRADQYRLNRDGIGVNLTSALRGPQVP